MSVLLQVYILIIMLIWGLVLGIIFDVYRFLLPTRKVKGITQYLFDTGFWLTTTIFTFVIIIFANFGEVRSYLILGIVLGFIIYSILFSKKVMKILSYLQGLVIHLAKLARKILGAVYRTIKSSFKIVLKIFMIALYPFFWLINLLLKPMEIFLSKKIKQIITKIKRN